MAERIEQFTATDGYRFSYRRYQPVSEPKSRIVFVHGIRSHGGWYIRSCEQLAAAGHEVIFLDRRGAGLNAEARGDCPSFRRLLSDIGEFLAQERARDPQRQLILGGISWGGKLAACVPYHRGVKIDGLILIVPGFCSRLAPPLIQRVRITLARVFRPARRFSIPLNEPELFTASAEGQRFIAEDQLGLVEASARFLVNSFQLDLYARKAVPVIACPVLLQLAVHDAIIDPAKTKAYLELRLKPGLLTVNNYPNAHHTLEFEQDCPFVQDMLMWLQKLN